MRVISGKYKGKNLDGFNIDGTRPTMDRVKESLFATIQIYLPKSKVLDLFAGSGALGIEALSNGALECDFVDNNKMIINILKKNTQGIANVNIIGKDYQLALKGFYEDKKKFNIIFLDPPYKLNLINNCLELIYHYDLLCKEGIIVCELETEEVKTEKFVEIKRKKYGNKCIILYKRVN